MSKQLGLAVPPMAKSLKAAYKITIQFDTGLLTFTLTRSEAETYLKENPPKGKWLDSPEPIDVAPRDFAHFGLPEPETLKSGVREGYVCPSGDEPSSVEVSPSASEDPLDSSYVAGTYDERCVKLYAHDYSPERTRIYLRNHYEPGISPLPVAPSSTD
ncbi:hypothetical protein ACSMX9_16865 [Streptomyces sp. LE64]|uniref:hypothetical protein n=1 Tax=Streptomyces sp. LE64 TaxID=3448653 RepID=UPI0040418EA9